MADIKIQSAATDTGYADPRITELEAEVARLTAELAEARALNRRARCTWCGHVDELSEDRSDLSAKIAEHVRNCPKHPINRVMEAVELATAGLQNELAEAQAGLTAAYMAGEQRGRKAMEAELAEARKKCFCCQGHGCDARCHCLDAARRENSHD